GRPRRRALPHQLRRGPRVRAHDPDHGGQPPHPHPRRLRRRLEEHGARPHAARAARGGRGDEPGPVGRARDPGARAPGRRAPHRGPRLVRRRLLGRDRVPPRRAPRDPRRAAGGDLAHPRPGQDPVGAAVAQAEGAPLRVALAGAGMISWYHLVAWRNLGPRARVVAVCDPDRAKATRRAEEFGIPCVYQDADAMWGGEAIDALDVASPRETHAAWVEAAAARGIPVLCQKPLTPTLAEAEALVRRVAGRTRLMVHENWRFRPWYRALRRWIDEGALGEVLLGQLATVSSGLLPDGAGRRPALERQPFMAREARLMIAEVLIHHLDTMRFLCGPLRVVGARAARTLADVRGETLAAIFLETAAGAPVTVTGTMAAP